jgi:pSer/pThr/pTyr-binding forkhead associated (FHA) protein
MSWQLAIEVIGGPMDGLFRPLSGKEVSIGRKVGQDVALDRDRKISNQHAVIRLEGHDWCLREDKKRPSKNGTSLDGKWIEPGESHPLRPNQVIVMGSTVIEVFAITGEEDSYPAFNHEEGDPRDAYGMTPQLNSIWNQIQFDHQEKGFIDSRSLFRGLTEKDRESGRGLFECVVNAISADCWVALGEWVVHRRLDPLFSVDEGALIYPPRIWRILDLASRSNDRLVGPQELLQALLEEGRSIPARYMAQDVHFLKAMGLQVPKHKIPTPLVNPTDVSVNRPHPPDPMSPSTDSTAAPPSHANQKEMEFWKKQAKDFETAVLAFLEDALLPPGVNIPFFLPGFSKRLDAFLDAEDREGTAEYLETMRYDLLGVMNAYKESARKVETEIISRIRDVIRNLNHQGGEAKGIWPIGKGDENGRTIDVLEKTIKNIELEGLSERILRQTIHSLFQNGGRS